MRVMADKQTSADAPKHLKDKFNELLNDNEKLMSDVKRQLRRNHNKLGNVRDLLDDYALRLEAINMDIQEDEMKIDAGEADEDDIYAIIAKLAANSTLLRETKKRLNEVIDKVDSLNEDMEAHGIKIDFVNIS